MLKNDMSMFKKMKERITDEVNSATNKLQNLQIIDQLASSIGQQPRPLDLQQTGLQNQQLPELSRLEEPGNRFETRSKFSLFDGSPEAGGRAASNEEDELNTSSEISPQHQLFNENSIIRLQSSAANTTSANTNHHHHHPRPDDDDKNNGHSEEQPTTAVINVQELNSDLEDYGDEEEEEEEEEEELFGVEGDSKEDCLDVEIDLLTDEPVIRKPHDSSLATNGKQDTTRWPERLTRYKAKHRQVVRALREVHSRLETERREFQLKRQELLEQIKNAKIQLDNSSKQNEEPATSSHSKTVAKVKDLEKLLAKCKDSLKAKNAQIKTLRESLAEVDSFRDQLQSLKKELVDVREAHEFWTVSIAENKRVMHQEIESKNSEIVVAKAEVANVKIQLADERNKARQLKSTIQDLENRLVGTSVAHQKERESLIRELGTDKNTAMKQLAREHELQMERVKLDLEKLVEAAKLESLRKEEELLKSLEQNRILEQKNSDASSLLADKDAALDALRGQVEECKKHLEEERLKVSGLEEELGKKCNLEEQIEALSKEVAAKDQSESVMTTTEFEYLKNIVHQFMLGREPLVLARVISAVFKFDQNQVEQICRIQEAIQHGYG